MTKQDDNTQSPPKSKLERIRDNQRRSRARRQEYLSDLEQRLNGCHLTCREADLQREAFQTLQHENSRLRELLTLAGFTDETIESYLHQNDGDESAKQPTLGRPIKPKITPSRSDCHSESDSKFYPSNSDLPTIDWSEFLQAYHDDLDWRLSSNVPATNPAESIEISDFLDDRVLREEGNSPFSTESAK